MKAKPCFKILFSFVCLCAFASATLAQEEKPKAVFAAVSIGEYYNTDKISKFYDLTEQLISRLEQEPETTQGLISIAENGDLAARVNKILEEHPNLKSRIIFAWKEKNPRPDSFVYFYIIPKGAKFPDLGCRMPICECPRLSVSEIKSAAKIDELIFTVKVEGGSETTMRYKWTISMGKIVEGQGTPTIKVAASNAKEITAAVEVEGICDECPDRTSELTTKIQ